MFDHDNKTDPYSRLKRALTKSRPFRHLFVLSVIALAFYFSNATPIYEQSLVTYYKLAYCSLCLLLCYINMYVLVPKLLFAGRPTQYRFSFFGMIAIASLAVIISQLILKSLDQSYYTKTIFVPPIIPNVFIATVFLGTSTAIKLFQQWIRDTKRINELTSAGLRSELEQLKNQINPHFLFNMLNNANVLIQKDPFKASQVIMKLSDLLRYQLYDSARENVLLTSEIQFLNDSLDLEKIRRDDFNYTVSKLGQVSGIQVPPFLFITFVENAIKHSLSSESPSFVDIRFDVEGKQVNFLCVNSCPLKKCFQEVGGLGLKNIKRRLELLFPNRHELTIIEQESHFTVKLKIQL
ncbi:histidine kinase [Mucilaginibacter sp. KACC 22773]|uniref:sensor histidine kinase n=1 Tax=Mucilaginibacter sp. KACC 22773 TaxID=3025671 RepID=UPI00236592A5|nr:histidine kinase [Mucilaginibacter sp. KACC 22773]WDF77082.1 histidine kinase [Mucilaginibacter sp. KACC 22773]